MVRRTRGISRSEFLRLSGAGLAGATLLGVAGCGGGQQGGGEVVRFFTGTAETTSQERANIEIQVDGFQEQYPKYTLEREAIPPDDVRTVIKTRCNPMSRQTSSPTTPVRVSGACWPTRGSCDDAATPEYCAYSLSRRV